MPRGQADFGAYSPKALGASLADMADLAVRLGSIVEYDRRGDIAYLDDYEGPVERFNKTGDAGCAAVLDSAYPYSGSQCVKLTTAGVDEDYYEIGYNIVPMVTGKHGCKIALNPVDMKTYDSKFWIYLIIWDGTHHHVAFIELNPHDKTIKYQNAAEVMTTFETNLQLEGMAGVLFHNIKVVIDLDTGKYVRLMMDTLSWDLSAYSYLKEAQVHVPYIAAGFALTDLEGHAHTIYMDNFVYTINEP